MSVRLPLAVIFNFRALFPMCGDCDRQVPTVDGSRLGFSLEHIFLFAVTSIQDVLKRLRIKKTENEQLDINRKA